MQKSLEPMNRRPKRRPRAKVDAFYHLVWEDVGPCRSDLNDPDVAGSSDDSDPGKYNFDSGS